MARSREPFVYFMASGPCGYVYIGVTSDLPRRVWQHRTGVLPGWAKKNKCRLLVRLEPFERMADAIAREKQLKNWHRPWKFNLIESENRHWEDLAVTVLGFARLED